MAATTGLPSRIRVGPIGPSPSGSTRFWSAVPIAWRSAPAQNVPPAPYRTAADASSSASKARKASASAAAVGPSTALRRSGRDSTTVVTGPARSTRTALAIRPLPAASASAASRSRTSVPEMPSRLRSGKPSARRAGEHRRGVAGRVPRLGDLGAPVVGRLELVAPAVRTEVPPRDPPVLLVLDDAVADPVGQPEQLHGDAEGGALREPVGAGDDALHRAGAVDAWVLPGVRDDREDHGGRRVDRRALRDQSVVHALNVAAEATAETAPPENGSAPGPLGPGAPSGSEGLGAPVCLVLTATTVPGGCSVGNPAPAKPPDHPMTKRSTMARTGDRPAVDPRIRCRSERAGRL